jgi:hypothetical protein
MESVGYMMLYFLQGRLPWHGLKGESEQQEAQLIMDMKKTISLEELCRDVPNEFKQYMSHVRALDCGGKPHYSMVRRMFRDLFIRHGLERL